MPRATASRPLAPASRPLLRTFFRAGLFENPYLDPAESAAVVGCEPFAAAGRAAQRDSLVLLKNRGRGAGAGRVLPLGEDVARVYVPHRRIEARLGFMRTPEPPRDLDPGASGTGPYERVTDPGRADAAVVFIESPLADPYSVQDREAGGNGYLPISLQYRPYTASTARAHSLAQGDFREAGRPDRAYRGKTARVANASDLEAVLAARRAMGDRPVIVVIRMHNPTVLAELEPYADAIVVDFGVQQEVVWGLLHGDAEPRGLLPVTLPASMETVEAHAEDLPFLRRRRRARRRLRLRHGLGRGHRGRPHGPVPARP